MDSGDLKGIYRQRKKAPASKHSSSSSSLPSKSKPSPITTTGSISETNDGDEEILMRFDLDMRYGPCLGMTRMARWERASRMGLDPPAEVEAILRVSSKAAVECVWNGRI